MPLEALPPEAEAAAAVGGEHEEQGAVRAAFPLALAPAVCLERGLCAADRALALLYAPWVDGAESSRWPHRVEYAPYLPRPNPR